MANATIWNALLTANCQNTLFVYVADWLGIFGTNILGIDQARIKARH